MCWVVGGIKLLWIMKNVCSAVTRCRSFPELWHIAKGLLVYHGTSISQPAIDWMALQKYSRGLVYRGRLLFSIWWCEDVQSTGTKRIFTWDATIDRVVWWKWKHWRGITPLHETINMERRSLVLSASSAPRANFKFGRQKSSTRVQAIDCNWRDVQ